MIILRKFCLFILCFLYFFLASSVSIAADVSSEEENYTNENNMTAGEISEMLDYGDLDQSLNQLDDYLADNYGDFSITDLWQKIKEGEFDFNFQSFFQILFDLFFGDLKSCSLIFLQLLVLVIISALLANFDNSFQNTAASLGQKIIYAVLVLTALQAFVVCGKSATEAIGLMSDFLYAIFPVLLTLFVAIGGVTSVGLYHPLLIFSVTAAINVINFFILPLVYCNGALTVAGSLNKDFDLDKLSGLLKSIALWSLTLMLTLFSVVVGIVGLGSAATDGLTMKTAKSALGMFIPVVGRSIADLLGTLTGTALILKNCLGVGGILVIAVICFVPAVKALIMSWFFRLCGALAEPLGDKQLAKALTGLGSVLTMLFAVVAACGIFFFFLLAITLAMGNLNFAIA